MKCSECLGKKFIEYEHGLIAVGCEICSATGEVDDSSSGTRPNNPPLGSGDTGKPKQRQKSKTKKKAGKGAG